MTFSGTIKPSEMKKQVAGQKAGRRTDYKIIPPEPIPNRPSKIHDSGFIGWFSECSNLVSLPEDIFSNIKPDMFMNSFTLSKLK